MTCAELIIHVQRVLAGHLGLDPADVTPEKTWADLGADSMDKANILLAFEEEFGIEIDKSEAREIGNVGEVITWLAAHS